MKAITAQILFGVFLMETDFGIILLFLVITPQESITPETCLMVNSKKEIKRVPPRMLDFS